MIGYFKSCLVLLIVCCLRVDGKAFERKQLLVSQKKQPHLQKALFQTRGGADTVPSSSTTTTTTTTLGNILNDKSAKDTLSSCLLAAGLSGSSDIVAQLIAGKNKCSLRRLLTSATAGVVALGVPGPVFYALMKKWFPAAAATTSDSSTKAFIFKLLIGSVVYGSLIATIFMAAALMQSDDTDFSWEALSENAEEELPRFALVTLLFWGLVYPQKERIGIAGPMFVWMTFLSMTAYK